MKCSFKRLRYEFEQIGGFFWICLQDESQKVKIKKTEK